MLELPPDFPHTPPKGYTYEVKLHNKSILSVWCCNHSEFSYNGGTVAKSIWGFYHIKKREYYSPINSKKPGKVVDIKKTTPYSAMQILRQMQPSVLSFC